MAKSLCCLLIYMLIMPWLQILTSQISLLTLFAYISEFTVVCVVTDVFIYVPMCLIHIKGIKNKKNTKKEIKRKKGHVENNKIRKKKQIES